MAIQALYPSRRYPQRDNPLLRRERRRQRLIFAAALAFSAVTMAAFKIVPNDASAESRPHMARLIQPQSHRHIRVIPLYQIPPEQADGIFSSQN